MNIETILNAYMKTSNLWKPERARQRGAFRDRILRTVATYRNFAEANDFDEKQAWFWTDEWQAAEKEVDEEVDND